MYKYLTLALAAASTVVAAPASNIERRSANFGLSSVIGGTTYYWDLLGTSTAGTYYFYGQTSTSNQSPVFTKKKSGSKYLALETSNAQGPLGIGAPDVGDSYGEAEYIFAKPDYTQYEWQVKSSGQITHELFAALEQFYACEDTVEGSSGYYLKWGVPKNNAAGSPPNGCTPIELEKNTLSD